MKKIHWYFVIAVFSLSATSLAHAEESLLRELGSLFGRFGTGVGEEIGNSMAKQQPQWKSKKVKMELKCIFFLVQFIKI